MGRNSNVNSKKIRAIRFTDDEWRELEKVAGAAKITVSDLIRHRLDDILRPLMEARIEKAKRQLLENPE